MPPRIPQVHYVATEYPDGLCRWSPDSPHRTDNPDDVTCGKCRRDSRFPEYKPPEDTYTRRKEQLTQIEMIVKRGTQAPEEKLELISEVLAWK
jgi:hypothetical protein